LTGSQPRAEEPAPQPETDEPPDERDTIAGSTLAVAGRTAAERPLAGRTAARLYAAAWFFSLAGVAAFGVRTMAARHDSPASGLLFVVGFASLGFGLAAGAVRQVVARRDRAPGAYRGPAPLLVLGLTVVLATLAAVASGALGLADPETSLGALGSVAAMTLAYGASVWLLAVRTGALHWTDMGWPPVPGRDVAWHLAGALIGGALVVPTYFASALVGGLLSIALGVRLDSPLPTPGGGVDLAATILAAVVLAPIGEELFFRGFALSAWWRDLGPRAALRRATLLFAAVHILNVTAATASEGLRMALVQFTVILPVAYVLGWLFMRRGIVAAIAGHMAFNGIAIALLVTGAGTR
jgi:membrane protease YdiL (CAAX protease family)